MKKTSVSFLAIFALGASISLQGCSTPAPSAGSSTLKVEKNILTYTITVPKDMLGGATKADLEKSAKKNGYTSATLNKDGSVTYVMPASIHDKAMTEMKQSTDKAIAGYVKDSDGVITSISHGSDMKTFEINVVKEKYEGSLTTAFTGMGLAISGTFYQIFDGAKSDQTTVDIVYKDNKSGKILDTQHYPQK